MAEAMPPPAASAGSSLGVGGENGFGTEQKRQICFDFTKGVCTRGANCKYSHDLNHIISVNSQERGICFDYLRGQCTRGLLCRFSHDLTNIQAQQVCLHPHRTPRARVALGYELRALRQGNLRKSLQRANLLCAASHNALSGST
jgi:Zinc finger C-x8-C-x5-C-x3-H type (and similar)